MNNTEILRAANPFSYCDDDSSITLDVEFSHVPGQLLPFTASRDDEADYSRELYFRAMYGEFGPVEERERPTLPVSEADLLRQRDALMAEATAKIDPLLDAKELGLATEQELAELAAEQRYRIELMRLPQSPSWPDAVEWPERPA